MTTVGTDIFQIIFTAGYGAITQYAIYGFIFYTLAMGMLLGSLIGIQIGAMATKVVPGITIRGFYAMAILSGFVNRVFALPSKLSDVGVLPLSKEAGAVLESIGVYAFFIVITIFSVWVIGAFLKSIPDPARKGGAPMIARKKEFALGAALLVSFFVILFIFFSPVFNGQNGLDYLDSLYNSISKGSVYYIPKMKDEAKTTNGKAVEVSLRMADPAQAQQSSDLVHEDRRHGERDRHHPQGLRRPREDPRERPVRRRRHVPNDGKKVGDRYGYNERQALYNWWQALKGVERDLLNQRKFEEAKTIANISKKALETSYNYYGIQAVKIMDRLGLVIFSLVFYVVYTMWYGFGILFMFEGWGLKIEH